MLNALLRPKPFKGSHKKLVSRVSKTTQPVILHPIYTGLMWSGKTNGKKFGP